MSDNVKVYYTDQGGPAAFAGKLLGAARAIGEDVSVVVFSPDGYFEVPAEVADEAGVSFEYDAAKAPEEPQGADVEPEDDADDPEVQDPEADAADGDPEPAEVVVPAKGEDGYLAGKGLEAALKDRGLPIEGSADDKRLAVATYDAENKE